MQSILPSCKNFLIFKAEQLSGGWNTPSVGIGSYRGGWPSGSGSTPSLRVAMGIEYRSRPVLRFPCKHCGRRLAGDLKEAGRTLRCAACGAATNAPSHTPEMARFRRTMHGRAMAGTSVRSAGEGTGPENTAFNVNGRAAAGVNGRRHPSPSRSTNGTGDKQPGSDPAENGAPPKKRESFRSILQSLQEIGFDVQSGSSPASNGGADKGNGAAGAGAGKPATGNGIKGAEGKGVARGTG